MEITALNMTLLEPGLRVRVCRDIRWFIRGEASRWEKDNLPFYIEGPAKEEMQGYYNALRMLGESDIAKVESLSLKGLGVFHSLEIAKIFRKAISDQKACETLQKDIDSWSIHGE